MSKMEQLIILGVAISILSIVWDKIRDTAMLIVGSVFMFLGFSLLSGQLIPETSTVHEIEGMILILIGVVCVGFSAVINELKKIRNTAKKSTESKIKDEESQEAAK